MEESEKRRLTGDLDEMLQMLLSLCAKMDEAVQLVESCEYQKALECFLSGLIGVAGTSACEHEISPSLKTLIENHPQAKQSLQERRDEMEHEIEEAGPRLELHDEWSILNDALGDDSREVALINFLRTSSNPNISQHIVMTIQFNMEKLLTDSRYDVIAPSLSELGRSFLLNAAQRDIMHLFPDQSKRDPYIADELQEFAESCERSSMKLHGVQLYEVCLGLEKLEIANGLKDRLLSISNSAEMFSQLLSAARRVRNEGQVSDLLKKARNDLPEGDLESLITEGTAPGASPDPANAGSE